MSQPVSVVWRRAEDGPTSESSQIVPDAVIEDDPLFNPDFPVTIPRLCRGLLLQSSKNLFRTNLNQLILIWVGFCENPQEIRRHVDGHIRVRCDQPNDARAGLNF